MHLSDDHAHLADSLVAGIGSEHLLVDPVNEFFNLGLVKHAEAGAQEHKVERDLML